MREAQQPVLVAVVVVLEGHELTLGVVVLDLRVVLDEALLQAEQSQVRTQVVRHAVVDHEFLLIAVARREVQLATEDCRKNVELLRVRGRDGTEA